MRKYFSYAAMLSASTIAYAEPGQWQNLGLEGGSIGETFITGDGSRVFAPTGGGLYVSDDQCQSWRLLGQDTVMTGQIIESPVDNTLFTLSPLRLQMSEDSGDNWIEIHLPENVGLRSIHPDNTDANTLYLLAVLNDEFVLFKTTDKGQTWAPLSTFSGTVQKVLVTGLAQQKIFAWVNDPTTLPHSLLVSEDDGNSWANVDLELTRIVDIDKSAAHPDHLYISGIDSFQRVIRSTDNGTTWQDVANLADIIGIDPSNGQVFGPPNVQAEIVQDGIIPLESYIKTEPDGTKPVVLSFPLAKGNISHISVDPSSSNRAYASTFYQGVLTSDDGGSTWQQCNQGLDVAFVGGVSYHPANPGEIVAYNGLGVISKTTDYGTSWQSIELPATVHVASIQHATTESDTLYVSPATQSIFKSIDGGDSFTILPKTVNVDLAIDPFNADHVFNGAVHSLDGGFNWVESITPLEGFNIKTASTTFDTVQPNVVVASVIQIKSNSEEKYQVQRSTDGGASWNITLELDTPPGKPVAVPGQSGHFYLPVPAYGLSKPTDGLFKSTDGGISWTSVLNIGATTVAVSAAAPERVVALTFNGLQISYNGGASWQFLTIAPGPTTPEQLLLDPYTATTVLVATSFGLYRYDFSNSDCTSRIHYDQNCDGKADILWRHQQTGLNWFYAMDGSNIIESRAINTVDLSWETAGRGDFNDDGLSDLLWINKDTGLVYLYYMEGGKFISGKPVTTIAPDSGWQVAAISDFNGDDKADILWRNNNDGRLWLYQMDGHSISASQHVTTITDLNWTVIDAPDLNGDGKADLLLRHATTGLVWRYLMDGAIITSSQKLISVGLEWQLVISGDFDGDKDADILWRNTQDGRNYVYLLDNGLINWAQRGFISQFADQQWQAILAGDFDGDGDDDIFWRHLGSGNNYLYLMDGLSFTGKALPPVNDMNWKAIK